MCSHSTLITYKEVADKVVTSMRIKGQPSDSALPAVIERINRDIVSHAQSPKLLMYMMIAILLLTTLVLPGVLIYFCGALPSLDETAVIRQQQYVWTVIRAPGMYKGNFGSLVLTTDGLALYYFKRPKLFVAKSEADKISLGQKKGKSFLEVQIDRQTFQLHATDAYLWMNDIQARLMA